MLKLFKNVQEWFSALVAWLTGSVQSAPKEVVENLLDEPQVRAFYNVAEAHLRSGGRSRFPQILRGGGTPSLPVAPIQRHRRPRRPDVSTEGEAIGSSLVMQLIRICMKRRSARFRCRSDLLPSPPETPEVTR